MSGEPRLRIACLTGDGIGPEIVPAAQRVVDAALAASGKAAADWVELPLGADAIAATGSALPPETHQGLAECEGWLVGPHDSASYPASWHEGPERVPGAELRGRYGLFANIRPARTRAGVPARAATFDLVIVRENTEGLYADRNLYTGSGELRPTKDMVLTVGLFTERAATRIATTAFGLARARRRHLTIVHKANVMPAAFGLFLTCCRAVGEDFPDVDVDDVLFDAMTAHLVRNPGAFDVIVTENLFGDALSDLTGELAGSLGLAASLNTGDEHAMAQAAHGSAPDLAGRDVANPTGMIVSAAMLVDWLGCRHGDEALRAAARTIEHAVDETLASGPRTADLGGSAGTRAFTDAVIERIAADQLKGDE